MDVISPYLLAPALAWTGAHSIKYLLHLLSGGKASDLKAFFSSGGMPSGHTALVSALVITVGAIEGINSAIFAVAASFAAIVIYDAMQIRRSAGEQGVSLQKLLVLAGLKDTPYNALGHKPAEVVAGGIIGVIIAVLVLSFS